MTAMMTIVPKGNAAVDCARAHRLTRAPGAGRRARGRPAAGRTPYAIAMVLLTQKATKNGPQNTMHVSSVLRTCARARARLSEPARVHSRAGRAAAAAAAHPRGAAHLLVVAAGRVAGDAGGERVEHDERGVHAAARVRRERAHAGQREDVDAEPEQLRAGADQRAEQVAAGREAEHVAVAVLPAALLRVLQRCARGARAVSAPGSTHRARHAPKRPKPHPRRRG